VRSSCCSPAKTAKADRRGDPVRKRFPGLRDASLFSYAIEMGRLILYNFLARSVQGVPG